MKFDAQYIINKLRSSKKIKDYSLIIAFFIVFSVFLWFAIRPNLITAFSLQQELVELREKDEHYESVILSIVDFQSKLESNRDQLYLLDEAIPEKPNVYDVLTEVRNVARESGLEILRMELREVELLDAETNKKDTSSQKNKAKRHVPERKEYLITVSSESDQDTINRFVDMLVRQRRLTLVRQVVFDPLEKAVPESSASAFMRVNFEIKGLYL